jgi:hypothetical protein
MRWAMFVTVMLWQTFLFGFGYYLGGSDER